MVKIFGYDRIVTDSSEAQITAKIMVNAKKAIIGSLNKLVNQTLVKVQLIDAINGNIEYTDQLSTNKHENLDNIIKRLAQSVATKKKAITKVEVDEVKEKEKKESTRQVTLREGLGEKEPLRSKTSLGVGGGFGFFLLGNSDISYPLLFNGSLLYETPDYFSELRFLVSLDFNNLTFNFFKISSEKNFMPYFGGGLGFGSSGYNSGIVLAPACGVLLSRTDDFHFMMDFRYYLLFAQNFKHGISLNLSIIYRFSKPIRCCCLW